MKRKIRTVIAATLLGALAGITLAVLPAEQGTSAVLADDPNWDSAPVTPAPPANETAILMDPNWD